MNPAIRALLCGFTTQRISSTGTCYPLLPVWLQTITWTNADLSPTGCLKTNLCKIKIKIQTFTFKKYTVHNMSAIFTRFWSEVQNVLVTTLMFYFIIYSLIYLFIYLFIHLFIHFFFFFFFFWGGGGDWPSVYVLKSSHYHWLLIQQRCVLLPLVNNSALYIHIGIYCIIAITIDCYYT